MCELYYLDPTLKCGPIKIHFCSCEQFFFEDVQ